MSTVIYLFNQEVQIVTGVAGKKTTAIKSAETIMAPEGSIINGIITDVESFTEFLKQVKAKYSLPSSGVMLVIGSTKFIGKNLDIPVMKDNETLKFIQREYADMGRDEEALFGFIRMNGSEKGMSKIYSESVDPYFIEGYVKLFEAAGIKLSGIYSSECGLINYISQKMLQEYRTFVMLVADAKNLATVLWVNGSYYYSNSVRIFHERGTVEYAEDMGKSISKLIQFLQARRVEEKLQSVVVAGIDPNYLPMYKQAIKDVDPDLNVVPYRLAYEMQPYMFAISGLYSAGTRDNFLLQYQQYVKSQGNDGKSNSLGKAILLPALLLIVLMGVVIALSVVKYTKQSELKKLERYNEAAEYDVVDYERYVMQNALLETQIQATKEVTDNIITYPCGNSVVLEVIEECAKGYADIEYNSFSAGSGYVSITASSDEVEKINQFIRRLLDEETFTKVDYTGYNYNQGDDTWNINVTCVLAESVGRPEGLNYDEYFGDEYYDDEYYDDEYWYD